MSPRGDRRPAEEVDDVGLGRSARHEVDDEIEFHISERAAELRASGLAPDEARSRAEAEFGPLESTRDALVRSTDRRRNRRRRTTLGSHLLGDLRYAVRAARSRPVASLVAVLSIALGMAAVSTMWTALDRLMLRPLPYDPDRSLVFVGTTERARWGGPSSPSAPGDFLDLQAAARTVDLAAYRESEANLAGDPPEWVALRRVTPEFFTVLNVAPTHGRDFAAEDVQSGEAPVAIISHGLWERRFGRGADVLGRTLRLNGEVKTIVGVLPRGFDFDRRDIDVYLPLHLEDDGVRASWSVLVIGRLRGDLEETRSELSLLGTRIAERTGSETERRFLANTVIGEWFSGPIVAQGMGASLAAALFVLLIACANVANILLARGTDRAGQIALRRALGASRARIVVQLLIESALLAAVGGAVGIALSTLGLRGLSSLTPPDMARISELHLDLRSVAIGMTMAFGSVALFGLIPALKTLAAGERHRLMSGPRTLLSRSSRHLRGVLVGVELALAAVLVTTTAVVAHSFAQLRGVDTGIEPEGVWSFVVGLPAELYPDGASIREGSVRVREALEAVPGVTGVGLSVGLPGYGWRSVNYQPPGVTEELERLPRVLTRIADAGYWETVRLAPLRGRGILDGDTDEGRPVAVVNASFAEQVWGEDDPIGRTLRVDDREVEIVGIAPDVREVSARIEPGPALYMPLEQWPSRGLSVVLRSASPEPPLDAVRAALAQVDGELAMRRSMPLREVLLRSADEVRAMSRLMGTMAAAALFLSIIGVYAATSYTVTQRTAEIGIRMALGAEAPRVRRGILRGALIVAAAGIGVGIPMSWGMSRVLSRYVLASGAGAVTPYLAVAALLTGVTLLAAWIPARHASTIDPATALRAE